MLMGSRLPDDGFESWFYIMRGPALRLARRMNHSSDGAADLVAEGFARALARWPKVGPLPYRDAWLLRTIANLSIDEARRKQPAVTVTAGVLTGDDTAALRAALTEALRHIPQRQREVIVLRYLADLSEEEIAAALAISAGTVKTHAKRGLIALRRRFDVPFEEMVPDAE